MSAWAWVETAHCTALSSVGRACDWSGMHWHWGNRRFRSVQELRPDEVIPFDRALGYPRPPGRITADSPLPPVDSNHEAPGPEPGGSASSPRGQHPDEESNLASTVLETAPRPAAGIDPSSVEEQA